MALRRGLYVQITERTDTLADGSGTVKQTETAEGDCLSRTPEMGRSQRRIRAIRAHRCATKSLCLDVVSAAWSEFRSVASVSHFSEGGMRSRYPAADYPLSALLIVAIGAPAAIGAPSVIGSSAMTPAL